MIILKILKFAGGICLLYISFYLGIFAYFAFTLSLVVVRIGYEEVKSAWVYVVAIPFLLLYYVPFLYCWFKAKKILLDDLLKERKITREEAKEAVKSLYKLGINY